MASASWVAFLRGINVGGHRKLPMADLKDLHALLRHTGVRTYIASGNVVFEASGSKHKLQTAISAAIKDRFNYDVPVVVLAAKDLRGILSDAPFTPDAIDPKKIGLAFTHGSLPKAAKDVSPETFGTNDLFEVGKDVIYLHYKNGMAKSKMTTGALEKLFGVSCTVRNWNTSAKMLELLEDRE